jgi:hypothetical protein
LRNREQRLLDLIRSSDRLSTKQAQDFDQANYDPYSPEVRDLDRNIASLSIADAQLLCAMFPRLTPEEKGQALVLLPTQPYWCALRTLERASSDSDASVRAAAAGQLWAFGDNLRVIRCLENLLQDSDAGVRGVARFSLETLAREFPAARSMVGDILERVPQDEK